MKKVLNVFISQPMNGRVDDILNERKGIMQILGVANPYKKTWEIHVIDHYPDYVDKDVPDYVENLREPLLWFLGEHLKSMADADLLVVATSYDNMTKQSCVELKAAYEYAIPVIFGPITDSPNDMVYLKNRMARIMRVKNKLVYNK